MLLILLMRKFVNLYDWIYESLLVFHTKSTQQILLKLDDNIACPSE